MLQKRNGKRKTSNKIYFEKQKLVEEKGKTKKGTVYVYYLTLQEQEL